MKNFKNLFASLVAVFVLALTFGFAAPVETNAASCEVFVYTTEYVSPHGAIGDVAITASDTGGNLVLSGYGTTNVSGQTTLYINERTPYSNWVKIEASATGWSFYDWNNINTPYIWVNCQNGAFITAGFAGV